MNSHFDVLLAELRTLRDEVKQLSSAVHGVQRAIPQLPTLEAIFTERGQGERKPFELRLDGLFSGTYPLTVVRTAILLVLISDLADRQRGGIGHSNRIGLICQVATRLSKQSGSEKAVREAIRRIPNFFKAEKLFATGNQLAFRANECQLAVAPGTFDAVDVRLRVRGRTLEEVRTTDLAVSPLERVRQQRVQFVPGGPVGFDRLFLEFFDHRFEVEERSFYFKPSIVTYPLTLLSRLGASAEDVSRKRIMENGFRSKRCRFIEVLNQQTLVEMTQRDSAGHFKLYGPLATVEDVSAHLAELRRFVIEYSPYYELVLTAEPLPFWISTFVIRRDPVEYYTVFFRHLIQEHDPEVDCFAICDYDVTNNVNNNLVERIRQNVAPNLRTADQMADEILRAESELRRNESTKPG
jgi:hypothetical protein